MKDYYNGKHRFERTTHMRVPKQTRKELRRLSDDKNRSMMNIMANLVREEFLQDKSSPKNN